ncbi:MAG TPA: malonate decarboxylase subunit epsilon [Steroidobacteraceae bacterium]
MMDRVIAILCSGQGAQHSAMFDLFAGSPALEPIFTAASEQLGQDPRRMVREAASAAPFTNRIAQILCCTQALAAFAALSKDQSLRCVIAGYSVGELAAWGCAGTLDPATTIRLANDRATMMDAATPKDCGLFAVTGLRWAQLEPILARHDAYVAIVNGSDSFVIGGRINALEACCNEAVANGASHTVRLRVAVPSHTPLLDEASRAFRVALRGVSPRALPARTRLLSGIDGAAVHDMEAGCDKLANQISTTINWAACLESCREAGAERALELGPGRALSRMAASMFREGYARSADDFRTLAGIRDWLS